MASSPEAQPTTNVQFRPKCRYFGRVEAQAAEPLGTGNSRMSKMLQSRKDSEVFSLQQCWNLPLYFVKAGGAMKFFSEITLPLSSKLVLFCCCSCCIWNLECTLFFSHAMSSFVGNVQYRYFWQYRTFPAFRHSYSVFTPFTCSYYLEACATINSFWNCWAPHANPLKKKKEEEDLGPCPIEMPGTVVCTSFQCSMKNSLRLIH